MRREELGLTQEEVAKRCGYKSRSSINKIELSRDLPLRKVEIMADALETTPGVLMGWDETLKNFRDMIAVEALDLIQADENDIETIKEKEYKVKFFSEVYQKIADGYYNIEIERGDPDEIRRNEQIKKALAFYDKYENADPNIKAAIESLLKGTQ